MINARLDELHAMISKQAMHVSVVRYIYISISYDLILLTNYVYVLYNHHLIHVVPYD